VANKDSGNGAKFKGFFDWWEENRDRKKKDAMYLAILTKGLLGA